jgi:DNA-binding IclR family transcriptional regulator
LVRGAALARLARALDIAPARMRELITVFVDIGFLSRLCKRRL